MSDGEKLVSYRVTDDVAYLTLNNPPVNIMTGAMMDEISALLDKIAADSTLKAVAITAEGKAFCAGADVGEHRPEQVADMIGAFGKMFHRFDELDIPLVMAVGGAAMGAGFELVLMADVLIAGEKSILGQPEIRLGFFAPVGVAELPARVGRARAMEITCSGRGYTAAEMADIGLVSSVVPESELDEALENTLNDFRKASPLVLRLNTRTLKNNRPGNFASALDNADKVFLEDLMTSQDPVEGINAFYEKRRPEWKNS